MKKKHERDDFDTQSSFYEVITDPYQVIAEFFSRAGVHTFRSFIRKLLHYTETEKVYTEKSPGIVLLYMRYIRSLIRAAHALKDKKNSPVEVGEGDLFNQRFFCSHYRSSSEWSDFPRCLSKKEFCNPYGAFRRFFKYKSPDEWIHDLEEIADTALSEYRGDQGRNTMVLHRRLVKLVEAAHLIDVREVMHIGGRLKNRYHDTCQ